MRREELDTGGACFPNADPNHREGQHRSEEWLPENDGQALEIRRHHYRSSSPSRHRYTVIFPCFCPTAHRENINYSPNPRKS